MSTAIANQDRLFDVETLLGVHVLTAKHAEYKKREVADQLRKQLIAFAEEVHPNRVIACFEKLKIESIFSHFLGALLGFRHQILPEGGQVAICNMAEVLEEGMAISDPHQRMFRRFPTLGQGWDWLCTLEFPEDEEKPEIDRVDGQLFTSAPLHGVTVLTLLDEDYGKATAADELIRQFKDFAESQKPTHVIVNFGAFSYPGYFSPFIGAVLHFSNKVLEPMGGHAAACGMAELVRETLRVFDPQQKALRRCDSLGQAYDWLRSLDSDA